MVFKKHEQRKSKLKDLAEGYAYAGLYLLASDLRLDTESLLRIIGGVQGITPELGRRIDYLWQIKFGTVYYPAPKSVLDMDIDIETIEKSSAFYYKDTMVGKKDEYLDPIFWDILTEQISEEEYKKNNALARVRNKIIPLLDAFFENLYVRPSENISVATLFGSERRKNRTFELHIIDRYTKVVRYALSYSQGDIQVSEGNLEADKIVYIVRTEGDWEL
ncbi:MAG TPA: hypothetical protein VIO11_00420 [Candidatus Methanoperedens sp.]